MKKNTSTKYKVNNTAADIVITFILLMLASLCLWLFTISYFRTDVRDDKNKIASITFKKNTVQRKNNDSVTWDRPKVSADIYDGDTIATSSNSEANILTLGQDKIAIADNTLIQLCIDKEGKIILDLSTGKINASSAKGDFTIKCGEEKITVRKNSSVTTFKTEKSSGVIVNSGKALFTDKDGRLSRLKEKENIKITAEGKIEKNKIIIEETREHKNEAQKENIITDNDNSEIDTSGIFIDETASEEKTEEKVQGTKENNAVKKEPQKKSVKEKATKKNTTAKKAVQKTTTQKNVPTKNTDKENSSSKNLPKLDTGAKKETAEKENTKIQVQKTEPVIIPQKTEVKEIEKEVTLLEVKVSQDEKVKGEEKQKAEIIPLEKVELISPAQGKVWTWEEILNDEKAIFKFKDVKNASEYTFKITEKKSGNIIFEKIIKASQKKEISLNLLDTFENSGEYTWSVSAKSVSDKGLVLSQSEESSRTFTINIQDLIIDALDGVKQTELYADVNTNTGDSKK